MEAKATAKYVRIAPRKVRVVMDLIRGKNIAEAFAILKFTPKIGADVIQDFEAHVPRHCRRGRKMRRREKVWVRK